MFVAIACESGKEVNLGREVLTLEKTKSTPKERDNPPPLAIAVATTRNIIPDTVHSKHSLEDGHQLRFISSSSPLLEKQTLYQYALVLWIAPPFIRHYISTRSFFGLHHLSSDDHHRAIISNIMPEIAIWDVVKFDGQYYIATYERNDPRNAPILAPRGGTPPPSTRNHKLMTVLEFVPPGRLIWLVKSFLRVFGHVGHHGHDGMPQPCTLADFESIKERINYWNVEP